MRTTCAVGGYCVRRKEKEGDTHTPWSLPSLEGYTIKWLEQLALRRERVGDMGSRTPVFVRFDFSPRAFIFKITCITKNL